MAWWEKEGELATTGHLCNLIICIQKVNAKFPCGSRSTELSDFSQSVQSGNKRECKTNIEKQVPRVMKSLLMSSLRNQHFTSTFSRQIIQFPGRSCKLSFLFPPCHQSTLESLFPCFPLIESFDVFALEL